MKYGLRLIGKDTEILSLAEKRLNAQGIPIGDIQIGNVTDEAAPSENAFLHRAVYRILTLQPLDAAEVLRFLDHTAHAGEVLRRYSWLVCSIASYLRLDPPVHEGNGYALLGDLLIPKASDEDAVDLTLPESRWCALFGQGVYEGRLRGLYTPSRIPLLLKENALLPVSPIETDTGRDETKSLTLHWFLPQESAQITLQCGTTYRAEQRADGFHMLTDSEADTYLVVHTGEDEIMVSKREALT